MKDYFRGKDLREGDVIVTRDFGAGVALIQKLKNSNGTEVFFDVARDYNSENMEVLLMVPFYKEQTYLVERQFHG